MTPAQWRALLERLLGTNKYLEHTSSHQLKLEPWLLAEIGKAALELHRQAVDLLAEMGTGEERDDDQETSEADAGGARGAEAREQRPAEERQAPG